MLNLLCSVIIPAYNTEKFIVEALDSVFAQTYRPLEVIVIDDGSTDKTAEVVRKYVRDVRSVHPEASGRDEQDNNVQGVRNVLDVRTNEVIEQAKQSNSSNISHEQSDRTIRTSHTNEAIELTYIHQHNSGPSKARNTGIKTSKGKYILFLDSDDMWTKGKLLKQIQLMEEHPDVGLLFGDSRRFSDEGNLVSSMLRKNSYNQDFFGDDFYVIDAYKKILANNNFITTGSVILRRECIEKIGFFDEELRHSEDVDLWLRIAFQYPIAYSKDLWLLRRIHRDNISEDFEAMYLGFIKVIRKHSEKYGEKMRQKGINVAMCCQKRYYELGYYFFSHNQFKKARKYFRESLLQYFHFKSFLYLLVTYLGRWNIDAVRKIKLKVTR